MSTNINLSSAKEFLKSTDGYQIFFSVLVVFGLVAPLFGFMAIALAHDQSGPKSWSGKMIMVLLSSLGATTIMLNLSESKASSKEVFWAWIIFSISIAIISLIGLGEIQLYKQCFM